MSLLDNPVFRQANGIDTPPKKTDPKPANKLTNTFLDANGVIPARAQPTPQPAPEPTPPSPARPEFFNRLPPEDQQAMRESAIRNISWDIGKTQDTIDAIGTSGGYVTQALRAEVEQKKAELRVWQPAGALPSAFPSDQQEAEEALTNAVNAYAVLDDDFMGPLLPNQRANTRAALTHAAIVAGFDPTEILQTIERDRAFSNHQRDSLNLQTDLVAIDRGHWSRLIGPHPELQGVFFGGGAIKGPDGRLYPLVIPTVHDSDGNHYNAGHVTSDAEIVETFGGEEDDWITLSSEVGPVRFNDRPSAIEYAAAFFAGTGGYQSPFGQSLNPNAYQALEISPTGYPHLRTDVSGEQTPGGPPSTLPGHPTRVNYVFVEGQLWSVNPDNSTAYPRRVRRADGGRAIIPNGPTRVGNAAAGADLAVTVAQGLVTAVTLDDSNNGYYQLQFEENSDGGRRALLRTYAMTNQNGHINIWPAYAYVNEEGDPTGHPIRYLSLTDTLPAFGQSPNGDYSIVQLD